jgi:phospholipase/lecithinase/hemolysin
MIASARNTAPWQLTGFATLLLLTSAPQVHADLITSLVSFGDSLSDTGNVYIATGDTYPQSPPYYNGHFSNGPIWLEDLAGRLGVAAPTPSLAGGTDNAWGGAQTGDGLSFMGTPNIGLQISTYLSLHTLSSTQLITVWGGANDFLNAGVTDPTIPVHNLASEISTLVAAGGRVFMVPNLPLLGNIPATNTLPQPQRDALDLLSSTFDTLLHGELNALQHSLGITIYQPNIEALFQNAMANPSAYGFTNVTDALLFSSNPNQSGYLFWDTVHPTVQASPFIADVAFASTVPEPSSMTIVLGAASVALFALRRKLAAHITRSSAQG